MSTTTAVAIAVLTALTPTVTCLIGISLQRQDTRDLRSEMRSEMGGLRADMINLRTQVHSDLLLIHERVATVEAKQR